jgi:ribosomal protein L11 methylase PrmA
MRSLALLSFLIFTLTPSLFWSQEIKVIDANTGDPIEGVALYNTQKTKSVLTDTFGAASLRDFSREDNVNVQFYGYVSQVLSPEEWGKDTKLILPLMPEEQSLEEVILSVARNPTSRKQIAEKVAVISKQEIELQRPTTGADLVSLSPGIRIQESQGNECAVRADFHPPMEKKYELVITPKMSFGTGHHETTQMMLAFALDISMTGKEVLDMGCGTGVLGILSAMKGAKTVHAIDNDPWCVENTIENAERNRCTNITVELADSLPDNNPRFDLIFANINRNVLLDQLSNYAAVLNPNGILLLSGFYQEDVAVIQNEAVVNGLTVDNQKSQGLWCALKFTK